MNALLTLGIVVYSIICVLLILIIIIQGGKAEGLFSSAQANVLGSQRGNALTKATTFLSTIFVVGALLISVAISTQKTAFENVTTNTATTQQQNTPLSAPTNTGTLPNNTVSSNQ
ncbi:preprotein translocase subunit SecG [Brachyspira sp. G79]|uniref:preprotein translocase subunit SecG n=1 Tax=Brachyspira sp. G79 TaxID=1358104 RepID=UPI000BBC5E53|nr:preprotein translocase subunit SecG [Brachyspira sp. G79]PCG19573.1 preprotein translocase subunit SecG [Brachyspira sp. G79]